jgi:diaminohydroxyphosphoribosylaminopyrimidine deaminase / 5-amino-6-(5-phosphoribosylamino)uracil reductase
MEILKDNVLMERALDLANQARVTAPPNPWVGCVIVNQGQIVGEGFTQMPGKAHAEIVALQQAQHRSKGATAYVTLEPCAHFGRTPPCVNALIEAGISRVVIGLQDPDEHVQGKGMEALRKAGVKVSEGVLSDKIAASLAPYLHHRKTGLPFCVLKSAASIDGRSAAKDRTSQWISSPEARADAHQLRAESQAIVIGSGTAAADHPALTVRDARQPSHPPLRIVLDAQGKTLPAGPLFDVSSAPTLIITSQSCPEKTKETWLKQGLQVEVVSQAANGMGVDLNQVLALLGKRGILQALIEGGGKVLGAFLEARLADQLVLYIGDCILGSRGLPLFDIENISTIGEAPRLKLLHTQILGNTIRLDYQLNKEPKDEYKNK